MSDSLNTTILMFVFASFVMWLLVLGYSVGLDKNEEQYKNDVIEQSIKSYWVGVNDGLYVSMQPAPQLTFRNEQEWREAVVSCASFGVCGYVRVR